MLLGPATEETVGICADRKPPPGDIFFCAYLLFLSFRPFNDPHKRAGK